MATIAENINTTFDTDAEPTQWKVVHLLEEEERQRRLLNKDEAIARKLNGLQVSDAIHIDAITIKARFLKRTPSSAWQRGKQAITSTAGAALQNLQSALAPTAEKIQGAVTPAAEKTASAFSNALDTARNAFSAATLSSVLDKASSIKNSVISSVQNISFGTSPYNTSLQYFKLLEENERQRRILEDNNGNARVNGKRISQLIQHAGNFPAARLHSNKGYNKFSNAAEERERIRRLSNRAEAEFRRYNAKKISADLTKQGFRLSSKAKGQEIRRANANKVAALIKAASLQKGKGYEYQYTQGLEEKERKYRLRNAQRARDNAIKEAKLIKGVGSPFYVAQDKAQTKENIIAAKPEAAAAKAAY